LETEGKGKTMKWNLGRAVDCDELSALLRQGASVIVFKQRPFLAVVSHTGVGELTVTKDCLDAVSDIVESTACKASNKVTIYRMKPTELKA